MSNDEPRPVSGSRWEQPRDEPARQDPQPSRVQASHPAPTTEYAAARTPTRNRGRLLLAGGAVGLALVSGAGGFALGQAIGDDRDAGMGGPGFAPNNSQQPPTFEEGADGQDSGQDSENGGADGDDAPVRPDDGVTQRSSDS